MRRNRIRYHANWVVPVTSPPIRDGWVNVENDLVRACGGPSASGDASGWLDVDLGRSAILPGVVNAHTHLELSSFSGVIPPSTSMPAWARRLMQRVGLGDPNAAETRVHAVREIRRSGTALVGDVTNTLDSLATFDTGAVDAVVFHELLGFDVLEDDASEVVRPLARLSAEWLDRRVQVRAAAHAPYSVSAELFRALTTVPGPRSVHLAESREEIEFLLNGGGPWQEVLDERGRWDGAWQPPGVGPVAFLESVGWLREDTLAVHGVHLTDAEIDRLVRARTTVVTCPRSNQWTGAGIPPVASFYARGLRVAIGTDSLASAPDLNLFAELAEVRRLAPDVPAARLLESATFVGAQALGRGSTHGAIESGRPAALIAVALPSDVSDVEEYLVNGVEPRQIKWLEDLGVE